MKKPTLTAMDAILIGTLLIAIAGTCYLWLLPATPPLSLSLTSIIKQADQERKVALIHFGAPWCPACRQLDHFLEEESVRQILDRYYVVAGIDIDADAAAHTDALRWSKDVMITMPWTVIVSADGELLATSDIPGQPFAQNIGFPTTEPAIAHFTAMLRSTSEISTGELEYIKDQLSGEESVH